MLRRRDPRMLQQPQPLPQKCPTKKTDDDWTDKAKKKMTRNTRRRTDWPRGKIVAAWHVAVVVDAVAVVVDVAAVGRRRRRAVGRRRRSLRKAKVDSKLERKRKRRKDDDEDDDDEEPGIWKCNRRWRRRMRRKRRRRRSESLRKRVSRKKLGNYGKPSKELMRAEMEILMMKREILKLKNLTPLSGRDNDRHRHHHRHHGHRHRHPSSS